MSGTKPKSNAMQHIENLSARILAFWTWFAETESAIREYFTDEELVDKAALIEAIDNRVLDFGLFSWTISQGAHRPFCLTISPNGNAERLRISKLIMQSAPPLPEWEFNYARPALEQALVFSLYDDFMVEQEVDASQWRYILEKRPDGKAVIILEAGNMRHLDPDTRAIAGEQVVNNLLGEEIVIEQVHRVEVVEELEQGRRAGSAPAEAMREWG